MILATDYEWWPLTPGRKYTLGRVVPGRTSDSDLLQVSGDPHISRQHLCLNVTGDSVKALRHPEAKNPIILENRVVEEFRLRVGESFRVCNTEFRLLESRSDFQVKDYSTPTLSTEVSSSKLQSVSGRVMEDCFTALLDLMPELQSASTDELWNVACNSLSSILRKGSAKPSIIQALRLSGDMNPTVLAQKVSGDDGPTLVSRRLLSRAVESGKTVAHVVEAESRSQFTLVENESWMIATPIRCEGESPLALAASGSESLQIDKELLERLASIVDIVAQTLSYHLAVQRSGELQGKLYAAKAAEENFANLLGVFGHHVGTIFKTSGALTVWSKSAANTPEHRAFNRLLPIWGISQAVSLHKKQGDKGWSDLLRDWIAPEWFQRPDALNKASESLFALASHVYSQAADEKPYFDWRFQDDNRDVTRLDWDALTSPKAPPILLKSLPPFRDNALLFDKTLAITIGLFELLANIRAYPSNRGAGREDREDLNLLHDDEREVLLSSRHTEEELVLEIYQPIIKGSDGSLPHSRSLDRIRSLESTLLNGIVQTSGMEIVGKTSVDFIVRSRQTWLYKWGLLREEYNSSLG